MIPSIGLQRNIRLLKEENALLKQKIKIYKEQLKKLKKSKGEKV